MEPQPDAVAATLALARALPAELVLALFRRYGRPLDVMLPPVADDDARVRLGDDATLRRVALRMPVDVIANDWFVLERAGAEPLAVAGPLFAAALQALARAAAR